MTPSPPTIAMMLAAVGAVGIATARAQGDPATDPAAPASAQQPRGGNDVEELIADLLAAHREPGGPESLDGFAAQMQLVPERKDADRITVITDVRFRVDGPRIRIKVDEGDRRIESGLDEAGPWARIDGELQNLRDRNWRKDREELKRRIRLAQQLVRFLDPASFAASLDEAEVSNDSLPGARRNVPYRTLSGISDAFPLYTADGERQRARIKLYLDAKTDRLTAVEAAPVDEQGTETSPGELYTMLDHESSGGLVLPTKLVFYRMTPKRRPVAELKVRLQQIDLAPEFDESTFDRNEAW